MGTRVNNWNQRLERVTDDYKSRAFRLGVADCATLTAAVVWAVRDIDINDYFRDGFDSQESLQEFLQARESKSPADFFEKYVMDEIGVKQVTPQEAKRGDLCIAQGTDLWPAFGFIADDETACFMGMAGLTELKRGRVLRAWAL